MTTSTAQRLNTALACAHDHMRSVGSDQLAYPTAFGSIASTLSVPAVGVIAARRDPVGNADGHLFAS